MRYVIYGAGGIGGGIGTQLLRAGYEVVLIARGPHLERIREVGLTVRTPEGTETLSIEAVKAPSEIDFRGDEVVFFTMKSQDTLAALKDLRERAGVDVPVIMAQNGVVNERSAARRFRRVYGMLVYMPALFLEPGVVVLHGMPRRGVLHAGCYPNGTDEHIEAVCGDLNEAGFDSRPELSIMRLKYGKLLMNLGNSAQALCGLEADLKDLTRALRLEGMRCFDAAGLDFVSAKGLVQLCEESYELGEIEGHPRLGGSSWQGLMRGVRSIESDYLNGEVVLLGQRHGVATPLNRSVQELAFEALHEGLEPGSIGVEEIWARARQDQQ